MMYLLLLWPLPALLAYYFKVERRVDILMLTVCLGWLPPVWLILLVVVWVEYN